MGTISSKEKHYFKVAAAWPTQSGSTGKSKELSPGLMVVADADLREVAGIFDR